MWNTDKLPSGRREGWNCIHLCSASPLLILKIQELVIIQYQEIIEKIITMHRTQKHHLGIYWNVWHEVILQKPTEG